jgi:hypothetical protein
LSTGNAGIGVSVDRRREASLQIWLRDLNRQKQIVMARIIKAFPVPRQFGVA